MAEPERYKAENNTDEYSSRSYSTNEDSEYRFTRDQIYSDAHYEPAGSSTEPPRYYKPPERTAKEAKPKKKKIKHLKNTGEVLDNIAGKILTSAKIYDAEIFSALRKYNS